MSLMNYINSCRSSLTKEYIYFSIAIMMSIIIAAIFLLHSSIKNFENERHLLLYHEAQKIQMLFDERMAYVEQVLQFVGTKIFNAPDQSTRNLAKIIEHHMDDFNDDAFSWGIFTLIDPNLNIVAESVSGFRSKPLRVDIERRLWINDAKKKFWSICFAKPDISIITDDYILPFGISVPNKDGTAPAWYLASGILLEKMTNRLLRAIDKSSSFIIIDKERNIVASSELEIFPMKEKLPDWLENYVFSKDVQHMYKTLSFGKFDYSYSIHSEKYPFIVLIGQNREMYDNLLRNELLPRIIVYIGVGVVFSLLMLFLRYQVIRPILLFGRCAHSISKGEQVSIPKYPQKELSILGNQLEKLGKINNNLRTKQMQLSKINNELQNANSFIQSNMSFLSHELTNPISTILGFAQLLKKKMSKASNKEALEFVDIIEKTGVHQQKQLNFFLRLFKFQEAPKKLEKKEIDLKQVIEWNVSMIRHHANKKNVRIEINVEPNLKMMGDEIMVGQVIQNLAANAAKYNKQDGKLTINAYSRYSNQVAIEFVDTGFGIAKEDMSKLFRKFTRLKNNDRKKTIGYGIGLDYAKRCVLLHGGKIIVKSKLGVGSSFIAIMQK